MKLTCTKEAINNAVATVSRAVSSRSNLPVLEGIYIKADADGKVTFIGNDLEIGIEAVTEGTVSEPGEVVINAKMLGNIIRSLTGDKISIEVNEKNAALIRSGAAKFEIAGIAAEEFPELPVVEAEYSVSLPGSVLKDMIEKTSFAVAASDNNPILTGCLLEIKNEGLSMVALDGYRMAIRKAAMENDFEEHRLIIPAKSLSELSRIISDGEEQVQIQATPRHAIFLFENCRMVTRLIEGEYINYQSVIPNSYEITLNCATSALTESIQRASLMILSDLVKSPVKFHIGDGNINVSCVTSAGAVDDNIAVDAQDVDLEIGFYNRFLLEAFRAVDTEMVTLKFNKAVNPLVITPTEGDDFLYLILPLRLKLD